MKLLEAKSNLLGSTDNQKDNSDHKNKKDADFTASFAKIEVPSGFEPL
ncbi:MAG TPA: hypothetical protein VK705_04045 [Ferruginibacter sp.]|jgi:hypothetical protein|nr:hypothetical protein [Ferruginibacter sp.]